MGASSQAATWGHGQGVEFCAGPLQRGYVWRNAIGCHVTSSFRPNRSRLEANRKQSLTLQPRVYLVDAGIRSDYGLAADAALHGTTQAVAAWMLIRMHQGETRSIRTAMRARQFG